MQCGTIIRQIKTVSLRMQVSQLGCGESKWYREWTDRHNFRKLYRNKATNHIHWGHIWWL